MSETALAAADPPAGRSSTSSTAPAGDPAAAALERLVDELDGCLVELQRARRRADILLRERRAGRPWLELVTAEDRPLVVESISTVLASLASAGHVFRREEAVALQAEKVSINRIAALFGVTRQRISALLRDREVAPEAEAGAPLG